MTEANPNAAAGPSELSLVLIQLFKGPLYRDTHEKLWDPLLKLRAPVSDHVAVLGLQIAIDENDGYAYLHSRPETDDESPLPRLIARHSLSFHVSVLLALLRKRLAEFDASSSDARLVVSRDQIIEMMRLYLPESSNDARTVKNIDAYLAKVVELGFLRRLRSDAEQFEVRRILRALVDGQWLADLDANIDSYLNDIGRSPETDAEAI
jgi:hypothetical protein